MSGEEETKASTQEQNELADVRRELAEVKSALAEVKGMVAMLVEHFGLAYAQQASDLLEPSPSWHWSVYYCCSWQALMRTLHCVTKAWRFKFDSNFGALAAEPVSLDRLTFPSTPVKHWQVLRLTLSKRCLPHKIPFMSAMKALFKVVAAEASHAPEKWPAAGTVTTTWADSGLSAKQDRKRAHVAPWTSCEMNELELLFGQEASSDDVHGSTNVSVTGCKARRPTLVGPQEVGTDRSTEKD